MRLGKTEEILFVRFCLLETNDGMCLGKNDDIQIDRFFFCWGGRMMTCDWVRSRNFTFNAFLCLAAITAFCRVEVMIVFGASTGIAGIQHNRDDTRTDGVVLPYVFFYVVL